MLAVMFVCKTFNEIVYQNKRFCEHLNLSDQIICKKYVDEIFFSNFIKSVFRVYSIVNQDVIVNSFLRYRTGNLRRVVSNAGILAYLLSCSRFGKSKVGFLCRYCLLPWVGEAKYFCESLLIILEAHVLKDVVMMLRNYLTLVKSILLLLHVFVIMRVTQALKILTGVCVCLRLEIQSKSLIVI